MLKLKDPLTSLYVIHGEEILLALEAANALFQAARRQGYQERQVFSVETGFDWSLLKAATRNLSLFAERKLLEVRIPGNINADCREALQQLAAYPPEDTITLITLPKLDRHQRQSKWFSALSKSATVIEIKPVTRAQLPSWIKERLKAQQQQLDQDALAFFVDRVEGNLLAAKQTIDTLALLYPPGQLTFPQLCQAVANMARFDVFQLAESWLGGDVARTMRMVDSFLAAGKTPALVLWSFTEDIRMLIRLRQGLKDGQNCHDLYKILRLWGPKQSLAESALKRIRASVLMQALGECARIDRQIKGAEVGDAWHSTRTLARLLAT